jgi:hypothetical protein
VFLASDEAYMVSGATYGDRRGQRQLHGLAIPGRLFRRALSALPHCPARRFRHRVSGGLSSAQANRFETTHSAIARRVLTEAEPTCGNSTALSSAMSSCGTPGSFSKTSSPAAKIVLFRRLD